MPLTQPDMGICGKPPDFLGTPRLFPLLPTEEVPGGQRVEVRLLFSLTFQRGGLFFLVDVCDSAFSLWMVPLPLRPSRDHGAGRHGDSKGRMEMLPAALCVSGFA